MRYRDAFPKPLGGLVKLAYREIRVSQGVQRVTEIATANRPLQCETLLVQLACLHILTSPKRGVAVPDESEGNSPPVTGAPEQSQTLLMQALAFCASSIQVDCVAQAEQRPRQSELVRGSIKKPGRLAKQSAFRDEVSDAVSQGMDGPAGTDAIAERPTNRDTLL